MANDKIKKKTEEKIREASKIGMVLIVNEAKHFYKSGMSETEFFKNVYGEIPESSRTKEGLNLFKQAFIYLDKAMTDEEIKKQESGDSFFSLCLLAKKSKSIENALVTDYEKGWPWKIILKVTIYVIQIILAIWFSKK